MPARVVRSRARVTTTETATSARLGALRSLERGGVAPRRDASPAEKKVAGPLLTEAMGSCSSKPGEVGAMPQQGSGSAATVDPQAIEAVRASANALHPKPATPERPVSPGYDRRVVSHDASKKPPAARAIVPEPFGFDEPVAPEPRELPDPRRAPRRAHRDDARPPRLDVEDARPAPLGAIPPGTTRRRGRGIPLDDDDLSREPRARGPLTLKRARELHADPSSAADANPTTSADADAGRRRRRDARWRPDGRPGLGRRPRCTASTAPSRWSASARLPTHARRVPGVARDPEPRRDDDDVRPESREFVSRPESREFRLPAVHARRRRRSREDAASHRRGGDGRDVWTRRDAAGASAPRRSGTRCGPRASFGRFRRRRRRRSRARASARGFEEGIGLDDEEGLFGDDAPREGANVGARARGEVVDDDGRDVASGGGGATPAEPEKKKSPLELELEQWGVRPPSADEAEDEVDVDGDVVLADETETEEGKTTRSDDDAAAEDSEATGLRARARPRDQSPARRGNPSTRSRASTDRSRMDGSPSRETPIDRERRRRRTRTPRRTRSRSIGDDGARTARRSRAT